MLHLLFIKKKKLRDVRVINGGIPHASLRALPLTLIELEPEEKHKMKRDSWMEKGEIVEKMAVILRY